MTVVESVVSLNFILNLSFCSQYIFSSHMFVYFMTPFNHAAYNGFVSVF